MLLRTVSSLLGLAILLSAIWAGLFWVFLVTTAAAILGIRELYRLHPPAVARPESPPSPKDEKQTDDVRDLEPPSSAAVSPVPSNPSNQPATNESESATSPPVNALESPAQIPKAAIEGMHEAPPSSLGSSPAIAPDEGENGRIATPLPLPLGLAWVAAFVIAGAGATGTFQFLGSSLGILAVGAFVATLWLIAFYRGSNWPVAAAYLVLGPVYVGFLLAHVLLLAQVGEVFFELDPLYFDPETGPSIYEVGRNWLMFALLVNSATDSGAYLVGRAFGRHPLAPTTSPNKTWEGAVGGFACAVVAALLLDRILDLGLGATVWDGARFAVNWQPLVIGATVGIISQFGDLLESRLKRVSQVKDSGTLIPGHGGMLDRLDSLLFTLPTVYYLLVAVLLL